MQGNKVTEHEKDIFDRMMGLPVLRIFGPFFAKHREVLLYLFFGGLAFFLNMALFFITKETPENGDNWVSRKQ